MIKENDFIEKMVQETIEMVESDKSNIRGFAIKSDRVINLIFDHARHCYIVNHGDSTIEIPDNWGPFKNRNTYEFEVNQADDDYHILDIFSHFFNEEFRCIKFAFVELHEYRRNAA